MGLFNDIAEIIGDKIYKKLEQKKPKTRDEAMEIGYDFACLVQDKIQAEIDDVVGDYCDDNNLEWEDEE